MVEQEVDEPHCDDAFLVGLRANVFLDNDEFFEGIAHFDERTLLLPQFFFRGHFIGRLNVILLAALVGDEVNFKLLQLAFTVDRLLTLHNAYVDRIAAHFQLVEDDVLHNVVFFYLPEIEAGIAQPNVRHVIFERRFKVLFAFDIVALRAVEEEGVGEIAEVVLCRDVTYRLALDAFERVGNLFGIGERADGRTQEIDDRVHLVGILNVVALDYVGEIDF